MSLGARATKGGAKTGKEKAQEKGKPDKPQPKEKVKPQATTEQLRMANMIDRKSEDASDVRRMVLELMEMTLCTEEEVCSALHDSDNDMVAACNLLLEDTHRIQGEWQTSEKKKKKPAAAGGNGEAEPPRDQEARSRSGPRPRRGEGEGGRGRGAGRGRGGARGGRGGRGRAPPRRNRHEPGTWNTPSDNVGGTTDSFPATEDWDNEEWSGSLSDTKVFTPSCSAQEPEPSANKQEDWDNPEPNGPTEHIPTYTYHNTLVAASPAPAPAAPPPHPALAAHQPHPAHRPRPEDNASPNGPTEHMYTYHETLVAASAPAAPPPHPAHRPRPEQITTANNLAHSEAPPLDSYRTTPHHQPMGMSGTLTAAQSQYLSQLTSGSYHHTPPPLAAPAPTAPERKPQRARVPPPSKIPSSAVEMPGGEGGMFLDVQFGALEPETLAETPPAPRPATNKQPATLQAEPAPAPAPAPEPAPEHTPAHTTYNTNSMLSESLSVDTTPASSQPAATESIVTNTTTSLEKQLSAGMKQLSVSSDQPAMHYAQPAAQQPASTHHRPKTVSQQNVYAHHAVSHHPPVYGGNVYAPQVNSSNASLTAASAMTSQYPSLTQYQPVINSYQQQTSSSATVYGGSALYTAAAGVAAPYTAYQPAQPKLQPKDSAQYESSVSSSNSLTSTSTTQAATAKVTTTTVSAAGGSNTGSVAASTYAAGALYTGTASATYAAYDEQMMRSTLPHHMGGYYEVGAYGAHGVTGTREGTFGLGAGERFGRADAASPQQVPAAALPPGYAYFYQPPPTTYQYGVYPTYGGGSNVGGVGGVGGVSGGGAGKLSTYSIPQQPPYDAQDTYKQAGPYTANTNKSAGGATQDLTNAAMYAKTHVQLNKVNSYEKAAFHSGTPPPFGAGSHLYIPAPPHHHPHHHAPQHQMDARVSSSHNRRESGSGGGRANAAKPASKPTYSQSYWAPN